MTLQDKQRLLAIVNKNSDLAQIVILLQKLTKDEAIDALKVMNLPLSKHMFIMGNFSELMEIKF